MSLRSSVTIDGAEVPSYSSAAEPRTPLLSLDATRSPSPLTTSRSLLIDSADGHGDSAAGSTDKGAAGAAVLEELDPRELTYVRSVVWVGVLVFLLFLGQMLVGLTVFPDTLITYYNSGVSCEGSVAASNEDCKAANAKYTLVTSIVTSVGCFVTFLGSPLLGTASDAYGRKKCVLFCAVFTVLQAAAMFGFAVWKTNLNFYFAANILASFDATAVLLAYLSDTVPPARRAYCFGGVFAMVSLAVVVGPFVGDALQPSTAYLCNVGISIVYFVACCMLPESLPMHARVPFHTRDLSPFRGFNVLYRYTMFRRLALVVFVSEFVQRGKFAVNFSFMKAEFGITEGFYAIVAAVFGTAGVISQSVVLKALVKRITNQRIMMIGLVATALNFAAYDFIWESWMVFPVEIFACFSFISFPAISAMKSNNVAETEQGRIQGALYGVKQLGGGLGPVIFGAVFNQFTGSHAVWYNPRFIWYIATFVSVLAIFIGLSVPAEVSSAEHHAFEAEAARAAEEEAEAALAQVDAVAGLNQLGSDGLPKLGVGSVVISAAPGVLLSAKSSLLGPRYAGASETTGHGVDEDGSGTVSPYKATATLGGLKRTQIAREESW